MPDVTLLLTIAIIAAALVFDFINGFHDAANSIATIVATRVLRPLVAVLWAASFNFLALFIFDTGVAKTVGSGMIDLKLVTPMVIFAGLLGAIAWNLITWWWKIPSSSSHALVGGYAGAALAHATVMLGFVKAPTVIIASGWGKTLLFVVLAPLFGMLLSSLLMIAIIWIFHRVKAQIADPLFRRLQLLSSAFLSLNHGANDAQKTAGIIAGALFAGGYTDHFVIPFWVLGLAYTTMAIGTAIGGWRIVQTMGARLTRIRPHSGFCAETAAACSIMLATLFKLPVSTTQTTTGAIIGVGFLQRVKSVRWGIASNILAAWVFTIPAAGGLAAIAMLLFHAMGLANFGVR